MAYCIILNNILYQTNSFPMAKVEIILFLVKLINKNESLYTDAFDRKDLAFNTKNLASINEAAEIINKSENTKILYVKLISPKNKHTNSSQLGSEIQFS